MIRIWQYVFAVAMAAFLVACGSGSSSSSNQYTVGGNVSGLGVGNTVSLRLNVSGGSYDNQNVSSNAAFTFGPQLASGSTYEVLVDTQPTGQTCTVSNGTGTIASASVTNVSVVCSTTKGRFVYSTLENAGKVAAFAINRDTGALTAVGSPVASGAYPMGVAVDPSNQFAYVTSYTENKVTVYTINAVTGALTYASQVATNESPKGIVVDPAGKFVYVTESSAQKVSSYAINATSGALTYANSFSAPDRFYPSSVAVIPSGSFLYYTTGYEGFVCPITIDRSTGSLSSDNQCWRETAITSNQVVVHPSGNFAYAAVGEYDVVGGQVGIIALNSTTGAVAQAGKMDINGLVVGVAVDPTGKYLYAIDSRNNLIYAYSVNASTGGLTAIGSSIATGSSPKSVTVDGSGKYVYVANGGDNTISTFSVNATTGALTLVNPTISTGSGTQPEAITSF